MVARDFPANVTGSVSMLPQSIDFINASILYDEEYTDEPSQSRRLKQEAGVLNNHLSESTPK